MTEQKLVRRNGKTHLGFVESDTKPGIEYEIARLKTGAVFCACPGCTFHKGACKHVDAFLAGERMDHQRAVKPTVRQERVRIKTKDETFTVRRAMSFGAIPIGGQ